MKRFAGLAVLAAVVLGFAATTWWLMPRERMPAAPAGAPAPTPLASTNQSRQPAAATSETARQQASAGMAPGAAVSDAEREHMAAMFAAEPALLDALEDATSAKDPRARENAERYLKSLTLPPPNPAATTTSPTIE